MDERTLGRRAVLGAGGLALGSFGLGAADLPAAADTATGRPWTIPALRRWRSGPGHFVLPERPRILVQPHQAERLRNEATLLRRDLRQVTGRRTLVEVTRRHARPGDILLRLGPRDDRLGREGYRIRLGRHATITGNTDTGVFYGTRSLLQMLRQSRRLPAGVGLDWPRYPERGLMLDIGRKHLTYDWIVARVREMAWLKLNYLHLHFTEDLGWRIESEQSPRVHSQDAFLTKSQIRRLVELCARHHIVVVPEVDMPGHMGAALRNHPQFQLTNLVGRAEPGKLDYTIPEARAFARGLVEEYADLFPGSWFHLGFDEFVPEDQHAQYPQLEAYAQDRFGPDANSRDGAIGFANDMIALLRSHGKSARVYHDGTFGGATQHLDRQAVVEWWTDFSPFALGTTPLPEPQEILDAGHRIMNIGWYPTYYSNLPSYYNMPRPDLQGFYETWRAHRFRGALFAENGTGTPYHDIDSSEPRNRGSRLSMWFDDPARETQDEAAAGVYPRLRIMAQQTWESPHLVPTYAEFARVISRVGPAPRV